MNGEASNRRRRYRPLIALFGFTVVLVPALLSTLSLFVLDRLWLSTSVAGKAEMSTALTCERMLIYVSNLIMSRGAQLEAAHSHIRLTLITSPLSPEQNVRVKEAHERALQHERQTIPILKNFGGDRVQFDGAHYLLPILLPDQQSAAQFPDAPAVAWNIFDMAYRERLDELLEAQLLISRRDVENKDGAQADVAKFLKKMDIIDRHFSHEQKELQKEQATNATQLSPDQPLVDAFSMARPTASMLSELFLVSNLAEEFCRQRQQQIATLGFSEYQRQTIATRIAYGGFIGALFLAILLVVAYARNINSRLIKLVKNAENISGANNKYEPIGGNDEIAYVQDVLTDVRSRLDELALRRRFIIEMVAHDIRTPIAAATTALALVAASKAQQPSDIQSIRQDLRSTTQFVEKLLLLRQSDLDAISADAVAPSAQPATATLLGSGLFRKMLILVGIPILLQIGWLWWMSDRLAVKEEIAIRQHAVAQGILEFASVVELETHGLSGLGLYMLSGNKHFYDHYSRDRAQLRDFQNLINSRPKKFIWDTEGTNELADVVGRLIATSTAGPKDGLDLQRVTDEYRSSMQDSLDQLRTMPDKWIAKIARQNAEDTKLLADSERFSVGVQKWIVAGLFANLAIYVLLFLFFIRNIQYRLKVLVTNARCLVKSPHEWRTVGGDDELKLLAQALDVARQRLEQATEQRAQMVVELTSSISAPLDRSTKAISNMLAGEGDADKQSRSDLQTSLSAIDQAKALVDDLLTLEKLEAGDFHLEFHDHTASDVVRESINLVSALAASKGIVFKEKLVATTFAIDKARIIQVIVNLLSNAIKFSPADSEINAICEESNAMIRISIVDHGPGMDEETARKVFDKFFQTDAGKRAGGFGLGLYICKQIVDLHRGEITVISKRGEGTTFCVILPTAPH